MENSTLLKKTKVNDTLYIFDIKPDAGVPDFIPGQYVALGLLPEAPRAEGSLPEREAPKPGRVIKRTYSVVSSPNEKDFLSFFVTIVPDGSFTPRLLALKEGERLFTAPKVIGTFTLESVPKDANLHLVATGTGIAPYVSMLSTPEVLAEYTGKINVICGVRYEDDVCYADELGAIQEKTPRISCYHTVSRPKDTWPGLTGYVQNLFSNQQITHCVDTDHLFICGNPAMVNDMLELFQSEGYVEATRKTPGNIHLERYW